MSAAKKQSVTAQALEIGRPVIEALGLDLVDVEWTKEGKHRFLRYFIDKRGGITIDECEAVSRAIDPLLDEQLDYREPYHLEVSSPGLDRPLKTTADLLRHVGREVEVSLYAPHHGRRKLSGYILSADDDTLCLTEEPPFDEHGAPTGAEVRDELERKNLAKVTQVIRF